MKKIILIGVIFLVAILAYYVYLSITMPNYDPVYTIEQVEIDSLDEKLYLKKKVWGISSDHQVIVISQSDEVKFEPNSKEEYIYEGTTPFFYKVTNDTIRVYVRKASQMPTNFNSKFKIEQVVLNNPDMMNLFEEHQAKGIELFSR